VGLRGGLKNYVRVCHPSRPFFARPLEGSCKTEKRGALPGGVARPLRRAGEEGARRGARSGPNAATGGRKKERVREQLALQGRGSRAEEAGTSLGCGAPGLAGVRPSRPAPRVGAGLPGPRE